ncbi:MAG: Smr/MutS family protein [Deltaproteobacteria bacterium]|nr:Smr/MutS family protein [Deltaproteobacteria bacterium]
MASSDFKGRLRALKKTLPEKYEKKAEKQPSSPVATPLFEGSFEEEMARLAVVRLPGDESDAESCEQHGQASTPRTVPPQSDAEMFAVAVGSFDKVFRDDLDWEDEREAKGKRSSRRHRFHPDDEIDLHGLTRAEALPKVAYFLERSVYNGLRSVLIITGRGKNSVAGEAVLRSAVIQFLEREGKKWASSWSEVPQRLGGEGALAVFLKSSV